MFCQVSDEVDLGSPLPSDGRTLQCQKYSGDATETFLLAETSTGGQRVYQVLHCLSYVNVYAIIIVLFISLDKSIIRTGSLRNTHSQETQHLSWETL